MSNPSPAPVDRAPLWTWLLAFALPAGLIGWINARSPGLVGNDSYYHLRMALLLPEFGFAREFPWLPDTLLGTGFVNLHWGFHAILCPFALAGQSLGVGAVTAAKLFLCLIAGVNGLLLAMVLRERKVPLAWLWSLTWLLLPWHYWLRHAYLRAYTVELSILLLLTWCWLRGNRRGVLLTAFAGMQVYANAVILLLPGFCWVAAALLTGEDRRRQFTLAGWLVAGTLVGLLLTPYFPHNLHFLKVQLWDIGAETPDAVGSEWKPYNAWTLIRQSLPLLALFGLALLLRLTRGVRLNASDTALLLLNLALLALTCKARRGMEYWPVFAVLSTAVLAAPFLRPRREPAEHTPAWLGLGAAAAAAGLLWFHHDAARIRGEGWLHELRKAMDVVKAASKPGEKVLIDDWDLFPYCFYYNTHNAYPAGLDPMFLAKADPWKWQVFSIITRGQSVKEVPHPQNPDAHYQVGLDDIHYTLGCRFTVVTDESPKLFGQLNRSDSFRRIYPAVPEGMEEYGIPVVAVFERLGL